MDGRGGFPPIITVLLFLVVIAAAVIVGWWFISVHTKAVGKPVLSVIGGVYADPGGNVVFTLANDGSVDYSGDVCVRLPNGERGCKTVAVPAGNTTKVEITGLNLTGLPKSYEVVIETRAGEQKVVCETIAPVGG